MANEGGWQKIAARDKIKPGEIYSTEIDGSPIALVEIEGKIFAISNTCTHEFALLSDGFLEAEEIECPLHQARFDVRTGSCVAGPATQDLDTNELKIEGGDVYVKMPE